MIMTPCVDKWERWDIGDINLCSLWKLYPCNYLKTSLMYVITSVLWTNHMGLTEDDFKQEFQDLGCGGRLLVVVICIIISVQKTMRVSLWDPHENVVLACDALHNVVKLSHNCQLYRLLMLLWDVFSIYLTGLCCTLVTSTFIFHFLT